MSVAVIEHNWEASPGLLERHLGRDDVVVRLHRGDPLPDPQQHRGIVVLGGFMGAYDEGEHPFLAAEKTMLRTAVAEGIPVLGICLGCQLLADALGGAAYRAPQMELRYGPCEVTPAGERDQVARHLRRPVLSFHQDTWDLPPGGILLATTAAYPQAFRLGSALGIQPHPEVTPEMVEGWLAAFPRERIEAAGADPDHVLAQMMEERGAAEATAESIFGAWFASLERAAPTAQ